MRTHEGYSWMWAEACALLDEAERRRRQYFRLLASARQPAWEPPVDIVRRGAEWHIVVALPGARAEDVTVQVQPGGLLVHTHVAPPYLLPGGELLRMEIPHGQMRRRIELPPGRYALLEQHVERGCLYLRLGEHQ